MAGNGRILTGFSQGGLKITHQAAFAVGFYVRIVSGKESAVNLYREGYERQLLDPRAADNLLHDVNSHEGREYLCGCLHAMSDEILTNFIVRLIQRAEHAEWGWRLAREAAEERE